MKPVSFLLGLYALIAGLHLLAEEFQNLPGIYATKPLLMICLAVLFLTSTQGYRGRLKDWILAGLTFSWLGDILLMLSNYQPELNSGLFFILGLASFLTTHIFYTLGFATFSREEGYLQQAWWRGWPIYLFLIFFYAFFLVKLGAMTLPVFLYAAVISIMALSAWNLKLALPAKTFRLLLAGALIFMLSDFLIALNKFQDIINLPAPRLLIMSTYLLAQWLIVLAVGRMLKKS